MGNLTNDLFKFLTADALRILVLGVFFAFLTLVQINKSLTSQELMVSKAITAIFACIVIVAATRFIWFKLTYKTPDAFQLRYAEFLNRTKPRK